MEGALLVNACVGLYRANGSNKQMPSNAPKNAIEKVRLQSFGDRYFDGHSSGAQWCLLSRQIYIV